jgi:hypothetical protein
LRHILTIAVLSGGLLAVAAEPARAATAAANPASAPILMAPAAAGYEYLSPEPGSERNSRWNNVVLRPGGALSPGRSDARALSVLGSTSGRHDGRFEVSDDGRTLVFTPARPFDPGETVRVLKIIRHCLKPDQRVFIGVIDPINPKVETAEQVRDRILEAAEYIFVFTTLGAHIPAPAILEMYRGRWQVELTFKRLKSLLALGHLKKVDPQGAKAWLQGKLLVAILIETLIALAERFFPWGYPLAPDSPSLPLAGDLTHAAPS